MKKLLFIAIIFNIIFSANAQDSEALYGSISSNKVNVRVGPGTQYPISWIYKQRNWPVEAVAQHQGWYKIRDIDGEEGWIYQRFFSKARYGITFNQEKDQNIVNMYKKRDGKRINAKFENGALVKILFCELDICRTSYGRTKGWIQRKHILNTENVPEED